MFVFVSRIAFIIFSLLLRFLLIDGKNKLNPFLAACAGVWIHGDLAKQFGPGLIAEDIIKAIPHTLKKLKNGKFTRKGISKKS